MERRQEIDLSRIFDASDYLHAAARAARVLCDKGPDIDLYEVNASLTQAIRTAEVALLALAEERDKAITELLGPGTELPRRPAR